MIFEKKMILIDNTENGQLKTKADYLQGLHITNIFKKKSKLFFEDITKYLKGFFIFVERTIEPIKQQISQQRENMEEKLFIKKKRLIIFKKYKRGNIIRKSRL